MVYAITIVCLSVCMLCTVKTAEHIKFFVHKWRQWSKSLELLEKPILGLDDWKTGSSFESAENGPKYHL